MHFEIFFFWRNASTVNQCNSARACITWYILNCVLMHSEKPFTNQDWKMGSRDWVESKYKIVLKIYFRKALRNHNGVYILMFGIVFFTLCPYIYIPKRCV